MRALLLTDMQPMNAITRYLGRGTPARRQADPVKLLARWQEGRKPETQRKYAEAIDKFAAWLGEPGPGPAIGKLLAMIADDPGQANETVHAYRSSMVERGLAPASINMHLAALRSLADAAKQFGYVTHDLTVKGLKSETYRDTRGPTPAEVGKLLELVSSHAIPAKAARDVAIVMLMYGRGLRRGEVESLDLVHFDAHAGRVNVMGKGRAQREWLTVPDPVAKALKQWIRHRGREPGPLFYMFRKTAMFAARLTADGIHQQMGKWGDELGIVLRPHGLRHSFVTTALDLSGGDVRRVRIAARQKKVETTIIYDDARQDHGGKIAGEVAKLMEGVIDRMEEEADA